MNSFCIVFLLIFKFSKIYLGVPKIRTFFWNKNFISFFTSMSSTEKPKDDKSPEKKEDAEKDVKEQPKPEIKLTDDDYVRIGMLMQSI